MKMKSIYRCPHCKQDIDTNFSHVSDEGVPKVIRCTNYHCNRLCLIPGHKLQNVLVIKRFDGTAPWKYHDDYAAFQPSKKVYVIVTQADNKFVANTDSEEIAEYITNLHNEYVKNK